MFQHAEPQSAERGLVFFVDSVLPLPDSAPRHLLVEFYNRHRAHSQREFRPPARDEALPENDTIALDEVVCREHLGGLLKSYERKAA